MNRMREQQFQDQLDVVKEFKQSKLLQDLEQTLLKKISLYKQLSEQKRERLLEINLLAYLDDQYYKNFIENIEEIESLLKLKLEEKHLKQKLNKLLVANVITTMETYLADTFINKVINEKDKDGNTLEITNEEILNLIALVKGFVKDIEQQINFSNLSEEERYPLRGSVTHYEAPTEPVAMEDWDVLK